MPLPTPSAQLPTQSELCALLDYNPETGVITWKVTRGPAMAGRTAGRIQTGGYRQIKVGEKFLMEHRVIWAMTYGAWPRDQIDHINSVRDDNRLINLREATGSQNQQNHRRAHKHSASGLLGAHFHKREGNWRAVIRVDRKQKHLGRFASAELAHAAYMKAKATLHPFQTIIAGEAQS